MKKKLLTLALGGLFLTAGFAASNVAIVDLTQVFQQAPQGSTAFNALKQQLSPQVAALQTAQQNLQKQATALQNNKSLSKKALAEQQAQLTQQGQVLQQKIQTFQQTASQQEQALLTSFGNEVKGIVAQIAKQNNYDLVLTAQGALYTTPQADITSQVLNVLKQQAATATPVNS